MSWPISKLVGKIVTSILDPKEGYRALFAKSDGWYDKDSDGVETKITNIASTGVESVTGDGVDNTDPQNPVISGGGGFFTPSTATEDVTHDADGNSFILNNYSELLFTTQDGPASISNTNNLGNNTISVDNVGMTISTTDQFGGYSFVIANTSQGIQFWTSTLKIRFPDGLPTYADDAAADSGGLQSGTLYKTAAGDMKIKL